jgi:integration host factor subunit alpha
MTLTKALIVEALWNKTDVPKLRSAALVDTVFELMKQTLESGEDVLISGFGKFSVREKQERKGRNPQTGEPLMLSARKVVTFKCAGVLKDKINGKG